MDSDLAKYLSKTDAGPVENEPEQKGLCQIEGPDEDGFVWAKTSLKFAPGFESPSFLIIHALFAAKSIRS